MIIILYMLIQGVIMILNEYKSTQAANYKMKISDRTARSVVIAVVVKSDIFCRRLYFLTFHIYIVGARNRVRIGVILFKVANSAGINE